MTKEEFFSSIALAMGFSELNDMQRQTYDAAQTRQDILLLSPTGSGKTVAFLMAVAAEQSVLVLVPSRELAQQVAEVAKRLPFIGRCICCYGGHDMRTEQQLLSTVDEKKPLLLIATPGRLLDHLDRENVNPAWFQRLVIDEFDKCLELGFTEEMRSILERLSEIRQRLLTSATHAVPIPMWVGMKNYIQVENMSSASETEKGKVKAEGSENAGKLSLYQVKSPIADKLETLLDLLCSFPNDAQIIVFSGYRESSERIAHFLTDHGIGCALYHGGLEQPMREKALVRFRGQSIRVLVSTDLASRGLDIPEVSHIVHYHLPADEETFTHRNGRTARAGASGEAFLIVGPEENLPVFVSEKTPYFRIKHSHTTRDAVTGLFAPRFETIYIGRGKREKLSKGDILGFFTKQGGITGAQIGRIDLFDHCAYCAVEREAVSDMLERVKGLKIKGMKTHYLVVSGS